MSYQAFLEQKRRRHIACGFTPSALNPSLHDFQRYLVEWACRLGRTRAHATGTLRVAIARCDAEIRRCTEYAGPDDLGALLGWMDWEAEKHMIQEQERKLRAAYLLGASALLLMLTPSLCLMAILIGLGDWPMALAMLVSHALIVAGAVPLGMRFIREVIKR